MGATLDALHRLQIIEDQLRSVRDQIESKLQAVRIHQRRLRTLESNTTDVHQEIRQAQANADRLDLDRKTHDEHIAHLRETLNKAKTNKEYAAVLTQLNTDKAAALKIEDQVLASLNRIDELKKQEAEHRTSLEREKARLAEVEQASQELEATLSSQLQELEQQREAAADEIPPEALHMFERARDKHEGEAMAIVEQPHPRRAEYNCSGCNMSVTLETVNALQSRDEVRMCQTCSRILYLEAPSSVPVR